MSWRMFAGQSMKQRDLVDGLGNLCSVLQEKCCSMDCIQIVHESGCFTCGFSMDHDLIPSHEEARKRYCIKKHM
jgi:hypothetical protein